ncbi:MAG: acetyl-CoA acyltransferase [Gammaproteobacteria bacterium]|jgi:acetyl-CoA acyltransferase
MNNAYICDPIRTAIGRYGGGLSMVRTDDLGAVPIKALMERNQGVDWEQIDDVYFGNANQAGEDNRNVARMSLLLAGLPVTVPGSTVNRLCGSGMDAVGMAARAIKSGEADLMIAGGVESMSRAPIVMPKAETAFSRNAEIFDTTIGWRFVNKLMKQQYGIDSMPETAENVAEEFDISREDQDIFATSSQQRAGRAQNSGVLAEEIVPVIISQRKTVPIIFEVDEHLRKNSKVESLSKLPTPFRQNGSVTAGNASGINDGACAMIIASEEAAHRHHLEPYARVVAMACAGVEPRIMGFGPAPATRKVLQISGLSLDDMDIIELNEAFAAQALAVTRYLGLPDDADFVNPNGGAIALGHPLGMSGARLITTAARQLRRIQGRYALCTMCVGVGQGIAIIIERV